MQKVCRIIITPSLFTFLIFLCLGVTSYKVNAEEVNLEKYNYIKENKNETKSLLNEPDVHNRQLIIKLKSGDVIKAYEGLTQQATTNRLAAKGYILVHVSPNENFEKKIEELIKNPNVEYVVPNYLVEQKETPNDPLFSQQWYLSSTNIASSWSVIKGTQQVKVAVIDSGVDPNHPDLANQLMTGYNFASKNTNFTDTFGHGTNVAGIIAAQTNNEVGISGINPRVKIIPIKVSDGGEIQLINVINGIYYAIDSGANVINMSYGSTQGNEAEYDALLTAYSKGITLVASSGNEGGSVSYPAAYPFVISVGSVNVQGNKSSFSNYGSALDIVAPGEGILTTTINQTYKSPSGTSFSAPIVSGAASLLLNEKPGISPNQIQWLLEKSTGGNWNQSTGFGRFDMYKALSINLPDLNGEISDNPGYGKQINFNQVYSESLQITDDIDWFQFDVASEKVLELSVQNHRDHDFVIWVRRESNGQIQWEEFIDNHDIGSGESYTFTASSGHYSVAIFDYNLRWSIDPYKFSVSTSSNKRIFGQTRISTAVEVSKEGWPNGLTHSERTVILARADNPADALSAAGLVGVKDAPILLTYPNQLDSITVNEIKRLNAAKIYVLGGPAAISYTVENKLRELGIATQRISGNDRFDTAYKINQEAGLLESTEALIVNGITVADALSASSISATKKIPVYLVRTESIPVNLPSSVKKVTILGGEKAVSSHIEQTINSLGVTTNRIYGGTRYETNINAIKAFQSTSSAFLLVRGTSTSRTSEDYPDAVAAAGLSLKNNAAIILINPGRKEDSVTNYLSGVSNLSAAILGGEAAIPTNRLEEMGIN
ncbi:S8 family serine peptidase [Robertmurraya sp. GLU-23]